MLKIELSSAWVHGVAMAICFFGWIGLTLFFDGIPNREEASRVLSEAVLFTSLVAALDLGICLRRQYVRKGQKQLSARIE